MDQNQLKTLISLAASLKSKTQCSICSDFMKHIAELQCSHRFCSSCIAQLRSSKTNAKCPVCLTSIGRRSICYKDQFADKLGRFVNDVCQLIKDQYAYEALSESRTENEKKESCLVLPCNDHRSLKQIMSAADNYTIEETHSEALVRQAEIKVVQELLEDECLEHFDRIANISKDESANSKNASKVSPAQTKKGKKRNSGTKSTSPNHSGSSSGWDRMENLTKSLKKGSKGYKQLKIHHGDSDGKSKMITRNKQNTSAEEKGKKQAEPENKRVETKKKSNRKMVVVLNRDENLDLKENSLKNITVKIDSVVSNKNQSLQRNNLQKGNKLTVTSTDADEPNVLAQPLPEALNNTNILYSVAPVPDELDNIHTIANLLTDKLKACAKASKQSNSKGLADCLANLLTYANRIVQISSEEAIRENTRAGINSAVDMQTGSVDKCVQTVKKQLHSVEVQTECVNLSTQTNEERLLTVPEADQNISQPHGSKTGKNNAKEETQSKLSGQSIIPSTPIQILRNKLRNSRCKNVIPISTDESSENKTTQQSNRILESPVATNILESKKLSGDKVTNSKSQKRRFKRIRQETADSDSEESEHPSKRKFLRDDLSVEFVDSAPSVGIQLESQSALDSQNMNYDEYLLEVMKKYDSASENAATKNVQNIATPSPIPNRSAVTNTNVKIKKSQKGPESGEHIFTECLALEENFSKFDNEILQFEKSARTCNTEMDIVENTPAVTPKSKRMRLSSKKNSLAQTDAVSRKKPPSSSHNKNNIGLTEELLGNMAGPSTLDRNIEIVPSQSEKLSDNVRDILEELKENGELFADNIEEEDSGGNVGDSNIKATIQDNVNRVDFDNDPEIEDELGKISFTAAEANTSKRSNVIVLENIKLRSPKENKRGEDLVELMDSSDEEIIETTPQKKKSTSMDRCVLENLPFEDSRCGSAIDDDPDYNLSGIYLPPPPEFEDQINESQPNQNVNCNGTTMNRSTLTSDRFTDFLVTPDENARHSEKPSDIRASNVTPNRSVSRKLLPDPKPSEGVFHDTESVFSPITKSPRLVTQSHHNPLVFTPRLSLKKPTLLTSTPNQKSILNYVVSSPSQDRPRKQSQKSKPCIMWSRILNKDLNVFTQLECKKLLTTSKVFSPQVTHVIVLVDEKGQIVSHTAKILQAIAAGIWVVRYEWTVDCLRMNQIVPEGPYEALDISGVPGPRMSRLSNKSKPLFKNFRFFCASPLESISKDDLQSILRLAGAEIATNLSDLSVRDDKVSLILTESSASEETERFEAWLEIYKTVTVDVEWLSICIGQYELVSFRQYLVAGDEASICDLGYPSSLIQSAPFSLSETT
uniref:RING-type E3 ubiquitin transferase BRCA1 n=1 Tax=Dendroctonus ponderosae TaxID=77166 RepID=A0AAR5P8X3_DENPD